MQDDENVFKPYVFILEENNVTGKWERKKKKYLKFKRHPDCEGKENIRFIVIRPDSKKMHVTTKKDIKYKIDKRWKEF